MKIITKLWIGLGVLIILSPIGLLLPAHFKAGPAWGEWGAGEIQKAAGYVPKGLEKLSSIWKAPLSGYSIIGERHLSAAYMISAVIGVAVIILAVIGIGKLLTRKEG